MNQIQKILQGFINIFLLSLLAWPAFGQNVSFSNINTANGLSNNFISFLAVDKKGFLWIGTNEGLNSYDGYSITNYSREEYPQIPSKTIVQLLCDSKDNIWMGSASGVTWIDEKRKFHRLILDDTLKTFNCPAIFETAIHGVVLYNGAGHFYFNKTKKKWEKLEWIPEQLDARYFGDISPFSSNQILYATESGITIIDFEKKKNVFEFPLQRAASVCKLNDSIVAATAEITSCIISISVQMK
ncbi:MAG: two-component regulator propeller domain-containing protein [Ginsengibacter sp.]